MRESARIARAVLTGIIEKLRSDERLFRQVITAVPGGFIDDPVTNERMRLDCAMGLWNLRRAYLNASRALASDDPEQIELASPHCEKLFSDGRILLQKYQAAEELRLQKQEAKEAEKAAAEAAMHQARAPQRSGGEKTAELQRKKAETRNKKYQDIYFAEMKKDPSRDKALTKVRAARRRDGQCIWSPPTERKWCPPPPFDK
jgi:hypothetical protein